jgi:hypothetical protein
VTESDAELVASLPGRLDAAEDLMARSLWPKPWVMGTTTANLQRYGFHEYESVALVVALVNALPAWIAEDRALLERHKPEEEHDFGGKVQLVCAGHLRDADDFENFYWPWPCPEVIAASHRWAAAGIAPKEKA